MRQFDQDKLTFGDTTAARSLIDDEIEMALQKFPWFPCDPVHAVAIMAEEAGEAVKAALDWTYKPTGKDIHKQEVQRELAQTAAMCIRMLHGIEVGGIKPQEEG